MLFLAKAAYGVSAVLLLSTAFVFHEGVIKVDVDENKEDGAHVHLWVPATAVNLGLQVVPPRNLEQAAREVHPYLPALRELAKELKKYPNAKLVEVRDPDKHVQVCIIDGKIQIDVVDPQETIHVRVPVDTLEDVSDRLEASVPTI